MDTILVCYGISLPASLLMLLPKSKIFEIRKFFQVWFAIVLSFIVFMEIASFSFVEEYDLRPDQKFWEYLKHVNEVGLTLAKVYPLQILCGVTFCGLFFYAYWKVTGILIGNYRDWSFIKRLSFFPLISFLLFFGARSTLSHRPANLSTAAFSPNNLLNELALNSTYSSLYAAYRLLRHDKNPSLSYGTLSRDEVLKIISEDTDIISDSLEKIPFLHHQDSPFETVRPKNVVIFLQESMGASDVGCLEGPDITPNLCRLRDEGLWFENLYATGTRTVRGIEATLSGFLPTSAPGVLKLAKSKTNFFTAASLFKAHGYETSFVYGGKSNFDEMKSFFLGNGFQAIHDEPSFVDPVFLGTWGVSDEDLVKKANEVFKSHGDKPFFSLILTTSNHLPYEFPDGRIDPYEKPKQTHFNAIKYADYAIGLFFELAKKEEYYQNTIFLVIADHNSHVKGNDLVPIEKFRIPGLLIGPGIEKGTYNKLSSQIDMLPTILHFTGLDTDHPMIGRNLMTLPESVPGRAFMQHASHNAYQVGEEVIIHRPDLPPLQFTYKNKQLLPSTLNPELERKALAYAHLPWILYSEEVYHLPDGNRH